MIWSGLGFLVVIISFGLQLATQMIVDATFDDDQYYLQHGWPKLLGFIVAATIILPLGRYLNWRELLREIDLDRLEEDLIRSSHRFLFVPMEYWSPILVVMGVVYLFV